MRFKIGDDFNKFWMGMKKDLDKDLGSRFFIKLGVCFFLEVVELILCLGSFSLFELERFLI